MPDPNKPTMFPRDCPRDCPHFRAWDMSIDDWTCRCDLLNVQIDECDMDYQRVRCPLDDASDRLGKICEDHGLTPEGVEFALTQYQKIICEITHGMMSKLNYYAKDILQMAQERWCDTCELKEAQEPVEPLEAEHTVFGTNKACPVCEKYLFPAGLFCPHCGRRLDWDD